MKKSKLIEKLEELQEINRKYEELLDEFVSKFDNFPELEAVLKKLAEMSLKVKEKNCQVVFEVVVSLFSQSDKIKEFGKIRSYIS